MEMVSTKNFNILTIAIIITLSIVEYSNSNRCIEQLILVGEFKIDFDKVEAYRHAYFNIHWNNVNYRQSAILRKYIDDLHMAAISNYQSVSLLGPLDWCIENIHQYRNGIMDHLKKMYCNEAFNSSPYTISSDAIAALATGYYYIYNKTRISDPVIGYYKYLINEFINSVEDTSALGPKEYCESECIKQITKVGEIEINSDAANAFTLSYFNLNTKFTKKNNRDILHLYLIDLFNAATSNYEDHVSQNSMEWCLANISTILLYVSPDKTEYECHEGLNSLGFKTTNSSIEDLRNAFFKLTMRNRFKGITKAYFMHLLQIVLSNIGTTNALGPREYCENYVVPITNTNNDNENNPIDATQLLDEQHQSTPNFDLNQPIYSDDLILEQNWNSNVPSAPTPSGINFITTNQFGLNLNEPINAPLSPEQLSNTRDVLFPPISSSSFAPQQGYNLDLNFPPEDDD